MNLCFKGTDYDLTCQICLGVWFENLKYPFRSVGVGEKRWEVASCVGREVLVKNILMKFCGGSGGGDRWAERLGATLTKESAGEMLTGNWMRLAPCS